MRTVVVACQGGGIHAAFEVGVLTEILKDVERGRFELKGISGTSAGALCALLVWYGLAPKNGAPGSAAEAVDILNRFWGEFVACTPAESILNFLTYGAFQVEEAEIPVLGLNAPVFAGLNPAGLLYKTVAACLPSVGIRKQYFDLDDLLVRTCQHFAKIDWPRVKTRLLVGASEVVNGFETVFDTDVNKYPERRKVKHWRQQLPLTLSSITAAGTLPTLRATEHIEGAGYYWDGLYSQNPPVREFVADDDAPDEVWVLRINPQQWPYPPQTNAEIQDRMNELMGNLSLNKELDFIQKVNDWNRRYKDFAAHHSHVNVRTIKMKEHTADELRYSSKFNRSRNFMDQLSAEGRQVARDWLDRWPNVGCYPEDAAYRNL
jgi:NTE family protein